MYLSLFQLTVIFNEKLKTPQIHFTKEVTDIFIYVAHDPDPDPNPVANIQTHL
jgi:hypothetical protein